MDHPELPIDPNDWRRIPDPPECEAECPGCGDPADDMGNGSWKCESCGWVGTEPKFVEPDDPHWEPDMSDFI